MFEFYFYHINTIIFKIKYLYFIKNLKLSITHHSYLRVLKVADRQDLPATHIIATLEF